MKQLYKKFVIFAGENNLLPKAICLLLSVLFWAYISKSQTATMRLRVPLEFKNLSPQLIVSEASSKTINITIEGNKENLNSTNVKDIKIKAVVNLTEPEIGKSKKYEIKFVKQRVPDNIDVSPAVRHVKLKVERLRNKWVKVIPRIRFDDSVQEEKIFGKRQIVPDYVQIAGPSSVIRNINYVYTEDIFIGNEDGIIQKSVEIDQENLKNIKLPKDTLITFTISINTKENVYNIEVPIKLVSVNNKFKYETKERRATLFLKSDGSNKLDRDDVEAIIDLSKVVLPKTGDKTKAILEKEFPITVRMRDNKENVKNFFSVEPDKAVLKIIEK